jgi:hypothetical protein
LYAFLISSMDLYVMPISSIAFMLSEEYKLWAGSTPKEATDFKHLTIHDGFGSVYHNVKRSHRNDGAISLKKLSLTYQWQTRYVSKTAFLLYRRAMHIAFRCGGGVAVVYCIIHWAIFCAVHQSR